MEKEHIHKGDIIDSGAPLLTLNHDDIVLRRKQLEFEIAKAHNEIEFQKNELIQLQSDLRYSKQMHQRYTELLEREKVLVNNGMIAPARIEYYNDTLNYYNKTQNDLQRRIVAQNSTHATINLLQLTLPFVTSTLSID